MRSPPRPDVLVATCMLVVLAASPLAHARDVTLKVHDMAGALPAGTRVEVQLLQDDGAPLGAPFLPRDDGAAPDAVAGDHLHTAPLAGLVADHGGITVRAAGRTWTGGFAYDATSDAVLLIGLEPSGLAAASTRELSFAQGPPVAGVGPTGASLMVQGAAPPGSTGSVAAAATPLHPPAQPPADAGHAAAAWRGWVLLGVGFACMTAGAWFGARPRTG